MSLRAVLAETKHRPYPLPEGKWFLTQWWKDLLFAHWPIDPAAIAPTLPPALEPDLFEGSAWIAVVPFAMHGVRMRGLPPLPFAANFLELNLRTYVRVRGSRQPAGVYFWSLDANSPLAVWGARSMFHLNYLRADMHAKQAGGWTHYTSFRTHSGYPPAEFICRYRGIEKPFSATYLDRWLTERYCLYTADSTGQLYRGDIHHLRWDLRAAQADIHTNTLPASIGVKTGLAPPFLLYSKAIQVAIWPLRKISPEASGMA
jgi:uncharacterized protein YqjF (DUF2071 family)